MHLGTLFFFSNHGKFSPWFTIIDQVTKYLRKVVGDSSRLQFSIELAKHRLVSLLPASASPPFSTRLQLLRKRERAWRFMEWKQRHTLKLPPTGSVYEFVGGLYGNGREDDSRVTASISFLELPSSDTPMDPPNLKTWTHAMGDVNIIDFTMDPSQDLLVLVALAPPEYVPSVDFTFSLLLEQKQIKVCLRTTHSLNHNESATPQISIVRASMPRQTLSIPPTVRSHRSCSCAGGRRSCGLAD